MPLKTAMPVQTLSAPSDIDQTTADLSRVPWSGRQSDGQVFGRLADILVNGRNDGTEVALVDPVDKNAQEYTEYLAREYPTVDEQLIAVANEAKRRSEQVDRLHEALLAQATVTPTISDEVVAQPASVLDKINTAIRTLSDQIPVLRVAAHRLMEQSDHGVNPETELAQFEQAVDRLQDLKNRIGDSRGA